MPTYILQHVHQPTECAAAFAAWQGYESPLRRNEAPASCLGGGHAVWWRVDAADVKAALALLPAFVAARTEAVAVRDVRIP